MGVTLMGLLPQLTRRLSDVAAFALAAMMLLTIADIVMKNLFHRPIPGTFELVEFLMVIAVFFGMPEVFRSQSNICVDLIDHLVNGMYSGRDQDLRCAGFAIISADPWLGDAAARPGTPSLIPQNTQEIGIPLFAYWVPILVGTALMIVAAIMAGLVGSARGCRRGRNLMGPGAIGLAGMAALIVLIFLRVPVGVAMGLVGFFGYAAIDGWGRALSVLGQAPFDVATGYTLTVVPLFIVMGDLALRAGMSAKLYDAARGPCSLACAARRPMRPSAPAPASAQYAARPWRRLPR